MNFYKFQQSQRMKNKKLKKIKINPQQEQHENRLSITSLLQRMSLHANCFIFSMVSFSVKGTLSGVPRWLSRLTI